ncbi:MAG: hypothetical protein DRI99_02120 [Candidatus Aminicenantes bacterium]|nr:MAG: hypothetical protein DRI99_02120 [Candidatus Aminicenantes bacterium]
MKKLKQNFLVLFFLFPLGLTLGFSKPSSTATPAAERLHSWAHHLQMLKESPFRLLHWRAVGPKFQGGRIESIACPPGNPKTIYVGVGAGNIWKTTNGGMTWEPIFEHESTFTIGSIAIAKSNPNIVWVGTGENLMARSSFAGMGVFKSTDGGRTWKNMGLVETHHIGKVIIHPENPDIVYVAALGHQYTFNPERGLFKTVDGGKHWAKCLYISEKVGVVDVVMDPSDPDTLYAAAWERDRKAWNNKVCGPGSGIYKTTDGGQTWKRLTNGFPSGPYVGRIGLAIAPSNPNIIYAVVDNLTPIPAKESKETRRKIIGGEVYKSVDKGETWVKVSQDLSFVGINYAFGDIRVSPKDENEVYVCGVNLAVSHDGGKSFHKVGGKVIHLHHHPTRALHLDQHDLWISPEDPNRLLLGNDGGLYLSEDRGKTWLHLNNLPIGEFYAISVDNNVPYRIYGGTQDNAALYGLAEQELDPVIDDSWRQIWVDIWGGGDSYYTLVDPTDPNIIYFEQQFGNLQRKDMKTGKIKRIRPKAKKGDPSLRFNWMTPFLISHHNPFILYVGANKVFKSLNRGDDWLCISPDLTTQPGPEKQGNVPFGTITTISESPIQPGLLYVGTDDGCVWVTRNDGVTWTKISEGLPPKWVSRVEASPHHLGTVYVSLTGYREDDFSAYLYKSSDFGQTWTKIVNNLPQESINVIREDPLYADILYIGTDQGGIFVSYDGGKNWYSLCADLPTTPVHDIAIQPREREMIIGTHGRSVFVIDLIPVQEYPKIKDKEFYLFPPRPARLPQQRDYTNDWIWETGRPAVFHFYLKQPQKIEIQILNDSREIVRKFVKEAKKGINRLTWNLAPAPPKKDLPTVYAPGKTLVKPGTYIVRFSAPGFQHEEKLRVEPAYLEIGDNKKNY